jgi:tetratricopeptide (TPR) repeat protein
LIKRFFHHLIAALAFISLSSHATTWQSFSHNTKGVSYLLRKEYYRAHKEFMSALEDDPLNLTVQMNLGLNYEANEEHEKAEKTYLSILPLLPENSEYSFPAHFNLGVIQGVQRKIPAALASYQKALEMKPDSKEVKTNIELLWQGGQGEGDGKDQENQKDSKSGKQGRNGKDDKDQKDQKDQKQPNESDNKQKKKPRPFQSQELKQEDVKRIMDELKNQEQNIRAQEYQKGAKEPANSKDW